MLMPGMSAAAAMQALHPALMAANPYAMFGGVPGYPLTAAAVAEAAGGTAGGWRGMSPLGPSMQYPYPYMMPYGLPPGLAAMPGMGMGMGMHPLQLQMAAAAQAAAAAAAQGGAHGAGLHPSMLSVTAAGGMGQLGMGPGGPAAAAAAANNALAMQAMYASYLGQQMSHPGLTMPPHLHPLTPAAGPGSAPPPVPVSYLNAGTHPLLAPPPASLAALAASTASTAAAAAALMALPQHHPHNPAPPHNP